MSTEETSDDIPRFHLLPCNIVFDGPAPISNYFLIKKSSTNHSQSQFTSHFRGRKLVGRKIDYTSSEANLVTAITKDSMDDSAVKELEIQTVIDSFVQWGHDHPSSITFNENYTELLEISSALHGLDS